MPAVKEAHPTEEELIRSSNPKTSSQKHSLSCSALFVQERIQPDWFKWCYEKTRSLSFCYERVVNLSTWWPRVTESQTSNILPQVLILLDVTSHRQEEWRNLWIGLSWYGFSLMSLIVKRSCSLKRSVKILPELVEVMLWEEKDFTLLCMFATGNHLLDD